ncbi:MAG: tubulin-like doman-containing protein [Candidatus Eremiobacterota bacterium]
MSLRAIKPTLVIGLGRQGKKIIEEFKSELFSNFGQLPSVQFMSVNFKDEILEEQNQKAIIEDFFTFRLGKELLEDWFKRACSVTLRNAEAFIDEHKLREKDKTGLIENLLRKKEGDIVKINIEEKPYMGYDAAGLKKAIEENSRKFEIEGIEKIQKIIDSNLVSGKEKTVYALEEEIKYSKLADKSTLSFLDTVEKTITETEGTVKKEGEKIKKEIEFQKAEWTKLIENTSSVTESAIPTHRKKLIDCLEKKLNLLVTEKAYKAIFELLSHVSVIIKGKVEKNRNNLNIISYIQEKIKGNIYDEKIDEKQDIYAEQRKHYEKLKNRINKIQEKFDELIETEWLTLDNKDEFLSKFTGFIKSYFIPAEKEETITPVNIKLGLTMDEMTLLPKSVCDDMEKKSCTWAEYNRWIKREIKKIKNRDAMAEDMKDAVRASSRSILWANIDSISSKIDQKLRDTTLIANRKILNEKGFELVEANDFDIFLIASLDDPLATGIYIDTIYLAEERVRYNHGTSNRYGLLLLPAVMEGEIQDKNEIQSLSYISLAELDHFLQGKGFKQYYYPGLYEIENTDKPFKTVFLVDYINSQGFAVESEKEREKMFREMLRAMILTPLGPNLKSLPAISASLQGDISGKNTSYGSFGISLMYFPADLVRKHCACLLGEKIISQLFIRDDFSEGKLKEETDASVNLINSVEDSSFIPKTPKLDRKQFENADPSVLVNRIKHESGLLESRFAEETEKDFAKQLQENLEKLESNIKEHIDKLSTDTSCALKSAALFVETIYNEVKAKKEAIQKKLKHTENFVKEDEERHFKNFDILQSAIDSFVIPFLGTVLPARRIDLIGYLSILPVVGLPVIIIILSILSFLLLLIPLVIIFFTYTVYFVKYLLSWKRYYEKYFESRDSLFNHIDKKILNRGQLISLKFKLKQMERMEEICCSKKDYLDKTIKKLSHIARDLYEESKEAKEEIFEPRGSLTYLLITDKDIERYRKDGPDTISYEGKQLYETLGNWDEEQGYLKEKIRKSLWNRYAFIEEMSADELLREQDNSLEKISEILRMSHPFWTVDEIKIRQRGSTGKIYFCGVNSSEESFIAKGLKENSLFSNMIFFSLNDRHLILLGQVETGVPLFALKSFNQMRKSYKFISAQKMYSAIEGATTDPVPLKMTEKYNHIRRTYLPARFLDIYIPPPDMEEEDIYENLSENPELMVIIEEKLQKLIVEKGKDNIIKKLLEIMTERVILTDERDVIQEYIKSVRNA